MLKLMPQERFNELWAFEQTPACEDRLRLAHSFLDLCSETVEERNEARFDSAGFAFSRAWRDCAMYRAFCLKCRKLEAAMCEPY